jgi:GT2 family glycosyltransferase
MRVSVVTPCFNAAQSVEATVCSVLAQTYAPIEYIVMDGGSTDGTPDIARRYADRLTLVSEPDSGQTNAINKGWHRATGDVLAWLNADDQYFPDTVETAVRFLQAHPDVGWVYGTPVSVGADGQPLPFRRASLPWDYDKLLSVGAFVSQPTVFLRRSVVEAAGPLDETLDYTMDYEYWLRIGRQFPAAYVPEIKARVVRSRATKTQSGGMKRIVELTRVLERYGGREIPVYVRHQWASAYLAQLGHNALRGKLNAAWADARTLSRHPSAVPWGAAKLVFRSLVGERSESRLRRRLFRSGG